MDTATDTTITKTSKATLDLAHLGNDISAMARRIKGFNLALGYLHHAYSEELLEGVEQLALDIEREAARLELVCDAMIEAQVAQ